MTSLLTFADNADAPISDQLAGHGVTHEPDANGRRVLHFRGESVGIASAQEAVALLRLLRSAEERGTSLERVRAHARAHAGYWEARKYGTPL